MSSKLISIQNSGESFEKTLALYHTAIQTAFNFYQNYSVEIYYGHNLPKKNPDISAHGTIKFYSEYASNFTWCPPCNKHELFSNRLSILEMLIRSHIISERVANKLSVDVEDFWKIVCQLPIGYIYPQFTRKLEEGAENIFDNVSFKKLHLEENYMSIYALLPNEKQYYSIYALELDGKIGRYYLDNPTSEYSDRNLYHMFKELSRKPILSGNSAILLTQIQSAVRKCRCIIGYREHKRYVRPNRDHALSLMLNGDKIIEPKNVSFSKYFDSIDKAFDTEQQANIAIANAYLDFIRENIYTLNL